jgi:hypothetical protein
MSVRIIIASVLAVAFLVGCAPTARSEAVGSGTPSAATGEPATGPSTPSPAAPIAQGGGHEHPSYVLDVQMPSKECTGLVEEALARGQPVAVPDEKCRAVMLQVLEIQRTAPPVETSPVTMVPTAPQPEPGTGGFPAAPAAENGASEAPSSAGASAAGPRPGLGRLIPFGRVIPNDPQ